MTRRSEDENRLPEDEKYIDEDFIEDDEIMEIDNKKRHVRILALIVAISLLFLVLGPALYNARLPQLGFLKESYELTKKPDIQRVQAAVTIIAVENRRGTGFNIDEDGLIVTNAHVVQDAENVLVAFKDGSEYKGEVIKVYTNIDLALINIEGKELPKLALEENEDVKENDEVLLVGNPLSFNSVANKALIVGKTTLSGSNEPVILVRGPIHEGSSGSPILNNNGNVVGIVFATIENNEEKLGLAIPVEYLNKELLNYR